MLCISLTKGDLPFMNALSSLSSRELLKNTLSLVCEERRVMSLVLCHLEEIESRRLYAGEGYSSLFTYCQKVLGYSENEAFLRIDSMRLLKVMPEMKQSLQEGKVTLSTLGLAQRVFRKKKESFKTRSQKKALLSLFESKSKKKCEKIIAEMAPETLIFEKEKVLTDDITELKIPIHSSLLTKLKRLQSLTGKHSYSELLELLADEALLKKDPEQNKRLKQSVGLEQVLGRSPSLPMKRAIQKRDEEQCTFIHPVTKERCDATRHLQFDHILPWALGGETKKENLRLLCFAHNQLESEKMFGARKKE
jgi:hypothetical protein